MLHALFLLIGVSIISFAFVELAPGDFFEEMQLNPQISRETLAALRARYGLDQPLPIRYLRWVGSAWKGDLGYSFAYNTPAASLLWVRARNTLILGGTATVLVWLIALIWGAWIAAAQGRWPDHLSTATTTVLLSVPELLIGLILLLLALRTGWLPAGGMHAVGFAELSSRARFTDTVSHLFLPALALVLGALPILVRHVRTAMIEALDSPFIVAARGHGIPPGRLVFRYALPAAANPLISLLGFSIGTLLSASLLVEVIMSWPGIGPLLLEAILARDLYLVIGAVMLSTLFLVGGNLLADALLYAADPRIRVELQ